MHHVLELLEKESFCKYKGYMCNYDFMQGPFYSLIWIECAIIAFVEGVFAKFQCIYYMAANFAFKSKFKVKLPWKRQVSFKFKIPFMFSKIALESLIK